VHHLEEVAAACLEADVVAPDPPRVAPAGEKILHGESGRHAEFLHNEVPGIVIPDWARGRMHAAGADGKQAGVAMAQELLAYARTKVAGAYLMPSFGRYEVCAQVLEVLT